MTGRKKLAALVLAAVVLVAAFVLIRRGAVKEAAWGVNLLHNPGFETVDGEGFPEGWTAEAYFRAPGISEFDLVAGLEGSAARIRNHEANDARFAQTVSVVPDTWYCLSGFVRAQAEGGLGANLSIEGVYVFSPSVYASTEGWEELVLYGRTGKKQTAVTVFARLGGYGGESAGEALFDSLSLHAVDQVPEGVHAVLWASEEPVQPVLPETDGQAAAPAWPWLAAIAAGYVLLAVALAKQAEREDKRLPERPEKAPRTQLVALLLAALGTRMAAALLIPGYGVDIGCFTSWANMMAELGPTGFYPSDVFSDYPPGYMLVLWPIGLLGRLMGTGATEWMVKQPAILCDVATVFLLYRQASKRMDERAALLMGVLYALNPLTYATGAAWGQIDSLPALFIMMTVLWAMEGRWSVALPVYVTAVLMKPQALMFGPLGLVAALVALIGRRDRKERVSFVKGTLWSVAVAAAVILPFSVRMGGLGWIVSLYAGTMSYYGNATINATNLYFLFGKNWGAPEAAASLPMKLIACLSWLVPVLFYVLKRPWVSDKTRASGADSGWLRRGGLPAGACAVALLLAALPLSLSALGTVMMVLSFVLVAGLQILSRDAGTLPLLGGVMLVAFYFSGVMMHERYIFAAVPLLMLAYVHKRDKGLFYLMLAVTVLAFLNVSVVLDRGVRIGGVEGHLSAPDFGIVSDSAALEYSLSAFSVLVTGYAIHTALRLVCGGASSRFAPASRKEKAEGPRTPGGELFRPFKARRLDRKDAGLLLAITAIYAVAAFVNLGSLKAPQHPWIARAEDMETLADLGEERAFTLLYYGGIHWRESDFWIETSSDGETWQTWPAQMRQGDCFTWKTHSGSYQGVEETVFTGQALEHRARYVKIRAETIGLTLMEVFLLDLETGKPLPVTAGRGQALFDEQDAFSGKPDWSNSMYFDEIYHARTAYEQLNALRGEEPSSIYETSHPPLGKLLMTVSLMVFGMTPFGWRFAGALAGVLMIPALYLLGGLLTRRRSGAVVPALLLAFDCMHFTQTRIATIDSFATLFIIWSFYFMLRYVLLDYYAQPFRRSLPFLGLSGLMMGLAIASKWTGFYAGAGLAVVFFWSLARRIREGLAAKRMLCTPLSGVEADRQEVITCAAESYQQRALGAVVWCLPFFILIPAVIYFLSFYPVFVRTPGGLSAGKVLSASQSMLSYHATKGLGMDHPFYSPWYEWPLSLRPMWFYAGERVGDTASTILTFGNPAIWWGGFAALIWAICQAVRGFLRSRATSISPGLGTGAWRETLVVIMVFAQYLPWVLVPRGTYIYHYFPVVPLIILCSTLFLDRLSERAPRTARALTWGFVSLSAALFIAFFPYASGVRVSTAWLDAMKWFPNWLYY